MGSRQTMSLIEQILLRLKEDKSVFSEIYGEERDRSFQSMAEILKTPNKVLKSYLRIPMDNGEIKRIEAYRVQHNNLLGPYKGGIRFHENVNEEHVITLATLMTLKNALHNLPLGGGKGGVVVNPRELSSREKNYICRKYVRNFARDIGPDSDIPAPDMGTGEREMDWMMAEYKNIHPGSQYLASFTGKSIDAGGTLGRKSATGKGTYFTYQWLVDNHQNFEHPNLKSIKKLAKKKETTVAVQGFGNVGSYAALEAYECTSSNNKVIAVSDRNITLYNKNGLDIPKLFKYAERYRDLPTNQEKLKKIDVEADILDRDSILTLNTEVLILAALEDVINASNMKKVKAKVIVEGANSPLTIEADKYLTSKNVLVIPDILANAGGVIVSFLEWKQDKDVEFYDEEKVYEKLYKRMSITFNEVYENMNKNTDLSLRNSTYFTSIKRLSVRLYKHGKLY